MNINGIVTHCQVPDCNQATDYIIDGYCTWHYERLVVDVLVKELTALQAEASRKQGQLTQAHARKRQAKGEAGIKDDPIFYHCKHGCGKKYTGWNLMEEHERFCSTKAKKPSTPRTPRQSVMHNELTDEDLSDE